MEITGQHERWHEPNSVDEADGGWFEGHRLELVNTDLSMAVMVEMRRHPARRRTSVRIAVLERDELAIGLVDIDLPSPKPAMTWEIRGSGIWCEMVCESPLSHWSYGLEAFALAVDEPRDLLDTGVGHRVPLGWELEFEATGPATWLGDGCYIQAGIGHGITLSADGEADIEGKARRWHWWGHDEPFIGDADEAPATDLQHGDIWLSDPVERLTLTEAGLSVSMGG